MLLFSWCHLWAPTFMMSSLSSIITVLKKNRPEDHGHVTGPPCFSSTFQRFFLWAETECNRSHHCSSVSHSQNIVLEVQLPVLCLSNLWFRSAHILFDTPRNLPKYYYAYDAVIEVIYNSVQCSLNSVKMSSTSYVLHTKQCETTQ